MEIVKKIEKYYKNKNYNSKSFRLCNFSFNENCSNLPVLSFFLRNEKCNYNKQRAPQLVIKIKMSQYTDDKYETPLSVIISQKKKYGEYLIKYIGANNTWKVIFGTQLFHEYKCNLINPLNMRSVFWDLKYSNLRIVNSILKWRNIKNLKDFDIMARELKNKVKFYNTKYPQIIVPSIKNKTNFKFNCNISFNSIATASNLKNYNNIKYIKNYVIKLIESINIGDEENIYLGKSFPQEYEGFIHDKRQFYNCLLFKNLKSSFFITKVKFYGERYIHYISTRTVFKHGTYPSLDFIKKNTENYFRLYPGQFKALVKLYKLRSVVFSDEEINNCK